MAAGKWSRQEITRVAKKYCSNRSQWCDEVKGKVVDLLTDSVSAVVRFQGGT